MTLDPPPFYRAVATKGWNTMEKLVSLIFMIPIGYFLGAGATITLVAYIWQRATDGSTPHRGGDDDISVGCGRCSSDDD